MESKTIGVTLEITLRMYKEFKITDEQFKKLYDWHYNIQDVIGVENYDNLVNDTELGKGDREIDYAISDEEGNPIIDWG